MLLKHQVIASLNIERHKAGLTLLTVDPLLMQTAQQHAEYMEKKQVLSHMGQNNSAFDARIKATGYVFSVAAENVALGAVDAAGGVDLWMESPPHRANILYEQITDLGIGFAPDEDSENTVLRYWSLTLVAPLQTIEEKSPLSAPKLTG